jgi:hypothetical protein
MATTPKTRPGDRIAPDARSVRTSRKSAAAASPTAPAAPAAPLPVAASRPAAGRKTAAAKPAPTARKSTAAPAPAVAANPAAVKTATKPAARTPAAAPAAKPAARAAAAAAPAPSPLPAGKQVAVKPAAAKKPAGTGPVDKPAAAKSATPAPVAKKASAKQADAKPVPARTAAGKTRVAGTPPAATAVAIPSTSKPAATKAAPGGKRAAAKPPAGAVAAGKPPVALAAPAQLPAGKRKPRQSHEAAAAPAVFAPAVFAPAVVTAVTTAAAPSADTAQAVLAVLAAGAPSDSGPLPTVAEAAPVAIPVAAPLPTAVATPATATPADATPPTAAPSGHRQRPPRRPARQDGATRPAPPQADLSPAAAPPAAAPTGPAYSRVALVDGDQRWLAWQPGHACPASLLQAASSRLDDQQHLRPDDDAALPTLLRLAAEAGHALRVDDAVWPHLATHRDARTRLAVLEAAYADGPASAGLRQLLRSPLPPFQAEGALFAVVAGRALLADERGLGKSVQAIAAAALWRRHFGVSRVLVLCAPDQRVAWQRAWRRFDGAVVDTSDAAQVMDGGLHQRQALWSSAAAVRILAPEALASDAAHLARWAPDLIIVDEPQQLGLRADDWAALQSPHALVVCGAPLAEQPALMDAIVGWLDTQRLGPLAALHELQSASAQALELSDADVERLTAALSRLMLQRLRDDVAEQLPALVHSERLLALAPGQREAHDAQLGVVQRLLAGWQHSGYLSDTDQWQLSLALRDAQRACQRADPADADSALADATLQALTAQLALWQAAGPLQVAVLCASSADRDQIAARLGAPAGVHLLLPADALPAGLDAVLQVGVPWRTRRSPAGPRGQATPGQQWLYLVAQDSLEAGLFETLALRGDAPRGLADGGGRAYLQGERLADWLGMVQAAVAAMAPGLPPAVRHA